MPLLSIFVSMIFYMLFLFLFLEYSREKQQFYKWFSIIAICSFPLWFLNIDSWFRWVKTISILIPLLFFNYIRISNDGKHQNRYMILKQKWPMWILYFILMLNIVEAMIQDASSGYYFNAACGLILCVTIPLPTKHWRVGKNDGKNTFAEILADLPLAWCLLYVTWNAAFVYGENIAYFASSLCILIVPQIWMFFKKRVDFWLMARVYTLAVHLLIRASYDIFTPVMDSTAWFSASFLRNWGLLNLSLHVVYLIYVFSKSHKKDSVLKYSEKYYAY
ncbi:MAG TPA: hypothetical protein VK861_05660 [Bacteroidales bacterium]|nr:hypothetical protein [Bacteroidales bacterium]